MRTNGKKLSFIISTIINEEVWAFDRVDKKKNCFEWRLIRLEEEKNTHTNVMSVDRKKKIYSK